MNDMMNNIEGTVTTDEKMVLVSDHPNVNECESYVVGDRGGVVEMEGNRLTVRIGSHVNNSHVHDVSSFNLHQSQNDDVCGEEAASLKVETILCKEAGEGCNDCGGKQNETIEEYNNDITSTSIVFEDAKEESSDATIIAADGDFDRTISTNDYPEQNHANQNVQGLGLVRNSGDSEDFSLQQIKTLTSTVTAPPSSRIRPPSLLPKPEISPKPAHLASLSPNRYFASTSPSCGQENGAISCPQTDAVTVMSSSHPTGGPTFGIKECFDGGYPKMSSPGRKKSPVFCKSLYVRGANGIPVLSQKSSNFPLANSSSCNQVPNLIGHVSTDAATSHPFAMADIKKSVSSKALNAKAAGTASMLKTTLKRMTRLSLRQPCKSVVVNSENQLSPQKIDSSSLPRNSSSSNNVSISASNRHITKEATTNSSKGFDRKKSLGIQNGHSNPVSSALTATEISNFRRKKGVVDQGCFKVPDHKTSSLGRKSLSRSISSSSSNSGGGANGVVNHRSHSLKRASRNKDTALAAAASAVAGQNGATLDKLESGNRDIKKVKRSLSMNHGSAGGQLSSNRRYRDKDLNVKHSRGIQTQLTKDVMDEYIETMPENADTEEIVTKVEFSVYLPDLIGAGGSNNDVETHVTEPTEPVDVRRNRQLTMDNMRLHRELEKLKNTVHDAENVKRELRQVRARLEDEQRTRARVEQELVEHNAKVKLIAESMDNVEKEFESRDANIMELENQVSSWKARVACLESELKSSSSTMAAQKTDLIKAITAHKATIREYAETEAEANELLEFLQAEKFTLTEALKDAEVEMDAWKVKFDASEERCGHLVRLGEQRHQENLALEAQLKGVENRAKEMLLAQGAAVSRACLDIDVLSSKVEELLQTHLPSAPADVKNNLVTPEANGSFNDTAMKSYLKTSFNSESVQSSTFINCGGSSVDTSLKSLSDAIKLRQKVSLEANGRSDLDDQDTETSTVTSLLCNRVVRVKMLVENLLEAKTAEAQILQEHEEQKTENDSSKFTRKSVADCSDQNGRRDDKGSGDEVAKLKEKYLKHKQILLSNYEQAESEVVRVDEIYHNTVNEVLKALAAIPEVVRSNPVLRTLERNMHAASLEPSDSSNLDNNGGNVMNLNGKEDGSRENQL